MKTPMIFNCLLSPKMTSDYIFLKSDLQIMTYDYDAVIGPQVSDFDMGEPG